MTHPAEEIRKQRLRLGMSRAKLALLAELSVKTIERIESGSEVRDLSKAALERALHWPEGTLDRMAEGEDIRAVADPEPPMTRPGETRIQVDAADGARMVEIPADELRRMRELIDELLGD